MYRTLQAVVGLTWVVLLFGCAGNPLVTLAYIFNNEEPKNTAELPLTPRPGKEKQPVRVLVLVSMKPGASEEGEYIGAEKTLNSDLIGVLESSCKENKELVDVLKYTTIDKLKRNNPSWRQWTAEQWKKEVGADYMIDVELTKISTFTKGSYDMMMSGQADLTTTFYDLSKPDGDMYVKDFATRVEFPRGREVERSEEEPNAFRRASSSGLPRRSA